jgi:hypothetical protein
MNRRRILSIFVISALGPIFLPRGAVAQSAKDLVGSWTIVSAAASMYGPTPKGSLIFEANGRYSLQLMRSDLPKYASNNRTRGTSAEYQATVEGSISYFGTYSVSGTDLILHVEVSTFPNWNGTDQKRNNLSVTGDELRFTNPVPSGGGAADSADPLVWKRAK